MVITLLFGVIALFAFVALSSSRKYTCITAFGVLGLLAFSTQNLDAQQTFPTLKVGDNVGVIDDASLLELESSTLVFVPTRLSLIHI